MKILIVIHMPDRDLYMARYLKRQILKKNNDAKVVVSTFNGIVKNVFLRGFHPDSVLMYTLRDEISVVWVSVLKLLTNAKVIAYENEGFLDYSSELIVNKRIGKALRDPDLIDRYYYWGPKSKDVMTSALMKKGFIRSEEQVAYCGYISYEMDRFESKLYLTKPDQNYLDRIKTYRKKFNKCYLVLTAFMQAEADVTYFKVNGEIISDDAEKIKRYALDKIKKSTLYRKKYVDFIKNYCQNYSGDCIIIKPHPGELEMKSCIEYYKAAFKDFQNVKVLSRPTQVGDLLCISDSVIHYGSTVIFEAYIHKIPTVWLQMAGPASNGYLASSTVRISLDEEYDQSDIVNLSYKKDTSIEKYLYDFFNYSSEEYNPSTTIADDLLDVTDVSPIKRFSPYQASMFKTKSFIILIKSILKTYLLEYKNDRSISLRKMLSSYAHILFGVKYV